MKGRFFIGSILAVVKKAGEILSGQAIIVARRRLDGKDGSSETLEMTAAAEPLASFAATIADRTM